MEPLQDTYTVRTRDGREYAGLTLSSLRIAAAQKIFSLEDAVRSDRMAGAWTPLARVLSLPEPAVQPIRPPAPASPNPEPRVSTGIALDLDSRPSRQAAPNPVIPTPSPYRPVPVAASFGLSEEEGPTRHRLRIAGAFLLVIGLLGILSYALGKPNPVTAVTMLVNTGLGVALVMNKEAARRWAAGWVVAGWALSCLVGTMAGGCFGLVLVGLITGLFYGGPACLLWGDECPKGRFWTGVTLMGVMLLLAVLGILLILVAGVALFQRMHA